LASLSRSIRVHGKGIDKYDNIRIGLNARLHTLQAAILLPKLEVFPKEIEERQRVANRYSSGFSDCDKLTIPHVPDGYQSVWAQYTLLAENRSAVQKQQIEKGIPTAVYYGRPLHLQAAYSGLGYHSGAMPVAERVSQQVFSLPMHPYLEDQEIDRIVAAVLAAM